MTGINEVDGISSSSVSGTEFIEDNESKPTDYYYELVLLISVLV
jgi:hypothetical protein